MCGIFGIVSKEEKTLGPTLIDAGRSLSYRGYDSVGCATIHSDGKIDLRKDAGKVEAVAERLAFAEMKGKRGIMQLRWATFGAPSQVNSQPHLDSDGDMVGAHNGNVVNNVELRELFKSEGMLVRSSNDGESCVHAVERYFNQGLSMTEAVRKSYDLLQGDYAYVIGHVTEEVLYALKKGSGLVVGIAEDATIVSSDLPSILPHTRKIMRVYDGEMVTLWPDRVEIRTVADGQIVNREAEIIKESMEAAQKGGYPHFMLKEINEQPKVAGELLKLLGELPDAAEMAEKIKNARNVYLIGCGTSYHACLLGSVFFNRLAGKACFPVIAPQFFPQFGKSISPEDVGIFVSQSGETKDVLTAMEYAQKKGMRILGLANVIGSTLMRVSENYLPMVCGYEISVPATKTYTNQVLAFLYLANLLKGEQNTWKESIPSLLKETINMVSPTVMELTSYLAGWDDLYILGFGATYAVALEGALKLKEITYAHCEGMLSTEFKHGPLSAVRDGYPVIFVAGPEDIPVIISGINEVTCRGGKAIVIGVEDERLRVNADHLIVMPKVDQETFAVLAAIPLQLLSYQISLKKGLDPDFPRNLSKTLTVD